MFAGDASPWPFEAPQPRRNTNVRRSSGHRAVLHRTCRGAETHADLSEPAPVVGLGPRRLGTLARGVEAVGRTGLPSTSPRLVAPPSPLLALGGAIDQGADQLLAERSRLTRPCIRCQTTTRAVNVGLTRDCPRGVVLCLQPALSECFARRPTPGPCSLRVVSKRRRDARSSWPSHTLCGRSGTVR